jgi:nitrogen fixation/metabolism regulation signal transduction histidine kinase
MVRAGGGVTVLPFRRQIRLFLAALVTFLVLIIFALLLMLFQRSEQLEANTLSQWDTVASSAAAEIERGGYESQEALEKIRMSYGLVSVVAQSGSGQPVQAGSSVPGSTYKITRHTDGTLVDFVFDATELRDRERHMSVLAVVIFTATFLGLALLLLFLPRIIDPFEQLLTEARRIRDPSTHDESTYLIDTFKQSIAQLQQQETELLRLREIDQARMTDLELITTTLTRSLSSGFLAMDQDGHLYDINASAQSILGLDKAEAIIGKRPVAALGDSPFARAIEQAFDSRSALLREEVNEGSTILGLTTVQLRGERDRYLGQIVLFSDLTEVRALEHRLRDIQTLADIGEMSAGIAHEFRNSLATINGYLRLASRATTAAESSRCVEKATAEAQQLAEAVDRLMAFARPTRLNLEKTDVREVVEHTIARIADTLDGIAVQVEGALTLTADSSLLSRAVENVIRNAAAAIRARGIAGRLEITLSEDPPSIQVRDNGVGLRDEDAQRLMLPFQSDRPDGFGLGLPLTRKIVALHGGTLRLTGQPGEGAAVEMVFVERPPPQIATAPLHRRTEVDTF